jgi:hypothetical protein
MIIAMPPMRMVQMIIHEVVDVVSVGDGLVAAAGAVGVAGFVLAARMSRSAGGRVRTAHVEAVLLYPVALLVMQVAVVQIIRVPVV